MLALTCAFNRNRGWIAALQIIYNVSLRNYLSVVSPPTRPVFRDKWTLPVDIIERTPGKRLQFWVFTVKPT